MIRELHDVNQVHPWVKWGPPKKYLLKDFAKIHVSIVLEHQADTNIYCSKHDQQSSNRLYALVFDSMTVKLCDSVLPTYNEICLSQRDGITRTKLVLDEIFFVSCNIINTLKNFLKIFRGRVSPRSNAKMYPWLPSSYMPLWLVWMKLAPCKTYGDILCDSIKCSIKDCKAGFQYLLTQERINHFSFHTPITTSFHGTSSSEALAIIKQNLCDANDLNNNFATSNKWVINCHVSACFNCGGDHGLNHCMEPHDQTWIVQNKAKFQEERNCWSSDGCSNEGCSCGDRHHQGHRSYERNKHGVENTSCVDTNGVHCFDGVWMTYCGKCYT